MRNQHLTIGCQLIGGSLFEPFETRHPKTVPYSINVHVDNHGSTNSQDSIRNLKSSSTETANTSERHVSRSVREVTMHMINGVLRDDHFKQRAESGSALVSVITRQDITNSEMDPLRRTSQLHRMGISGAEKHINRFIKG